ncbi:MAG: hypothetical protein J6R08_07875 [Opitutales bacterium]|nr:hypothetical protein [Opitutales bacterium]
MKRNRLKSPLGTIYTYSFEGSKPETSASQRNPHRDFRELQVRKAANAAKFKFAFSKACLN